jgi:hypothetical protein
MEQAKYNPKNKFEAVVFWISKIMAAVGAFTLGAMMLVNRY